MTGRTLRGALFAAALAAGVVGASATPAVASPRSGGPANHGGNLFGRHHFMGGRIIRGRASCGVQVVASGLNQPKKITISPRGNLIVALSGDGVAPATCTDGNEPPCIDHFRCDRSHHPMGQSRPWRAGLPSVSAGGPGASATGPAEAAFVNGSLQVLFQNTDIDPTTGAEAYGTAGALLGDLVISPTSAERFHRSGLRCIRGGQQSRRRRRDGRAAGGRSRPSTVTRTPSCRTTAGSSSPTQRGTTCSSCLAAERSRCWRCSRRSPRSRHP